jgi:RNA polymerase sigma-70 factor (ECF subfamily)
MLQTLEKAETISDKWERRSGAPGGSVTQQERDTVGQADEGDKHAAQLMAIAARADEAAFADLFAYFAPRVKAFLIRAGAAHDVAEDLVQDVMATVWRKAGQFDPSRASAATWIFTIARNRRIDVLRRERRPEPDDLPWGPEPEPDQAEALALQQDTERLGEALRALPHEQRNLLERAYFGDLSHGEIAQITGLPLGTIKSRIRLAIDKLRRSMN